MAPEKQKTHGRLRLTARPRPGESFIGFLLRLTELNGYERLSWIPKMSGLGEVGFHAYGLVFREDQNLTPLSELTGVSQVELASLLYEPAPSDTSTFRNYVFGLPIPKYFIRPRRPKICPACLCEDGYCQKVWELAPVTACPNHGCVLLDECPNCRKGISWSRKDVCICACGHDWRDIKSASVDDSALGLSRRIYSKCGQPIRDFMRGEPGNPLDELALEDLLSAVFFVAAQHTGMLDTKGKFTAVDRRNVELHEILTKAVSVFEEWPKRFEQFISWRQNQFSSRKKGRTQTGLYKDFGTFYFGLYHSLPSACFDFMRTAFEKYVEEYWDGGYTSVIGRHRGLRLTHKKYVGLTEAALTLGTWIDGINLLIERGKLEAVVRVKGKKRLVLIERTSVEQFKRQLDDSLGLSEAAELLGISMPAVKDLMQHGCISPLRGLPVDGFNNWTFSRESLNGLLERIEKKIVPHGADKTLTFAAALVKIGEHCSGLGGFVKMVLDGEIIPCAKSVGTGLYKFSFSEEQILEQRRAKRGGAYYLTEAAKLLNVTTEIVRFLIKKGIIPTGPVMTGQYELSVNEEGIDTFTSTYTMAGKLAATLQSSSEFVVDTLEGCGVLPVSGMKIDGGPAYVFRNSDLKAVNFAEAVSKQRTKYRPSAKSKLCVDQAADVLGVDSRTVQRLVENGVLRPYVPKGGKGNSDVEVYFTTYMLERFKRRFGRDMKLAIEVVSIDVAITMLDESSGRFYLRWVNTGRLKSVEIRDAGKIRYFLREDILAIVGFRKTALTLTEASRIMKQPARIILAWMKSGKLKAVSGPHIDGFDNYFYLRQDIEGLNANNKRRLRASSYGKGSNESRPGHNHYRV